MGVLNIAIMNRVARKSDGYRVAAGAINRDSCEFIFDEEWDGLIKVAVFRHGAIEKEQLIVDGSCLVPWEVQQTAGFYEVNAVGRLYDGETLTDRITTTPVSQEIEFSRIEAEESQEPTPSLIEQVIAIAEAQKVSSAEAIAAQGQAEIAEANAKISEANAKTSETNAKRSEDNAKISEDNAKTSEVNAGQSASEALINKLNGIDAHNTDPYSHQSLAIWIADVDALARGKNKGYTFATYGQMIEWISTHYPGLNVGDNLYIIDTEVPDYWWDGEQPQMLEANAVNLADYYTKSQIDSMMPIPIEQSDYDALISSGEVIAGRIYYVVPDGALGA